MKKLNLKGSILSDLEMKNIYGGVDDNQCGLNEAGKCGTGCGRLLKCVGTPGQCRCEPEDSETAHSEDF